MEDYIINSSGRHKSYIFMLLVCIFTGLLITPNALYAQDEAGQFEFDGYTREYEVYLPQNFQPNMPLVIALPGIYYSIGGFKEEIYLHEIADTSGFIVVYAQAIGRSPCWNVGPNYIDSRRNFPDTDDVGFLSALIDTVHAHYNVDLERVYCCGHSTGGEMSFRMAGECGQRFAAVASVSGSLFDAAYKWQMIRPMSVLQMHGTGYEHWYPYDEGFEGIWPIPKMIDFWLNTLQCSAQTDTLFFPDIVEKDSSQVQKITWTDCATENEFVHYKIINGGHPWPGGTYISPPPENTNLDINAGVEILNFFKKHRNPLAHIAYGKSIEVDPANLSPTGELIYITAQVANPENHAVTVYGMIRNGNDTFQDSIQLFDDGLHDDGKASDHKWAGSKKVEHGLEDIFEVRLRTNDLEAETAHDIHLDALRYFTTIGPIELTDTTHIDSFYTDGRFRKQHLKLKFINLGHSKTSTNLSAKMDSDDPRVAAVSPYMIHINDIAPGEEQWSAPTSFNYALGFGPDSTIGNPIQFFCTIYINGYPFWIDTLDYVTPVEKLKCPHAPLKFRLDQNYPNPFNPSTVISWQLAVGSHVELVVYNTLGEKVAILVSQKMNPGRHHYTFNGRDLASGVYYYQLVAGDYREVKKMILLR